MKMSKKFEALQDLSNGVPWDKLTRRYSKSTLYDAFKDYAPTAHKMYTELEEKKEILLKEVEKIQTNLNLIKTQERSLTQKVKNAETKCVAFEKKIDELKTQVKIEEKNLALLKGEFLKLEARGIKVELLTSILGCDIGSAEELVERIETKHRYEVLQDEKLELEKHLGNIHEMKKREEEKLISLVEQSRSEENKLDEIKSRNAYWQDSLSVTVKAFDLGFTSDILCDLLEALFNLSVKGEPILSARRLLRRLEKVKEEYELDNAIKRTSTELGVLKNEHTELVATISSLKKNAKDILRDAQHTAIQIINEVTENVKVSLEKTANNSMTSIQGVDLTSRQAITNVAKTGRNAITKQQQEISNIFYNNHMAIQLALETYKDDIAKWGDLREQAGQYTTWIDMAIILFGVQQDADAILKLDTATITKLTERIHTYITKKWSGAKTKAPKDIANREFEFSEWHEVNLPSLTWWLVRARIHIKALEDVRIQYQKDKYSLRDFRQLVKKGVTKEIKQGIEDQAMALTKQVPQLVEAEIGRYPDHCTVETRRNIDNKARLLCDAYLKNPTRCQTWFQIQVQSRAQHIADQLMDNEFERRVSSEAENSLFTMINYQWPRQLSEKFTPFAKYTSRAVAEANNQLSAAMLELLWYTYNHINS